MDEAGLLDLIEGVRTGRVAPDEAVARLRRLPFADLGFARVDHHRALRQVMGEAVLAPGKTAAQCAAIVAELLDHPGGPVLLTRADPSQITAVLDVAPHGVVTASTVAWRPAPSRPEPVVVVTAGTADLAVADECAATLGAYGISPTRLSDVGVAGIHRLLADADTLARARCVVVVAGMEGALASLVGGLVAAPVVAVPVSAGYGAAFEGLTALLGMLATCAAGVTVVGIDNGFGAAAAVVRTLGWPSRG
ncbi:MAG: nickel pincer cofactor biosynthesis protein LarB [Acidimicrobiales bacterium]